jgi:hypothetical protein
MPIPGTTGTIIEKGIHTEDISKEDHNEMLTLLTNLENVPILLEREHYKNQTVIDKNKLPVEDEDPDYYIWFTPPPKIKEL